MKKYGKSDDGLVSSIAGGMLAAPFVAFFLLIKSLFYFLEKPLSRLLALERHSLYWPALKWILVPLQWVAGFGFLYSSLYVAFLLWVKEELVLPVLPVVLYLAAAALCSFTFNVITWIQQQFYSASVQKKIAGRNAERFVKQIIETHRHRYPEAISMHGVPLAFHLGTDQEFSLEVDHLLITKNHFFVIETKYKSGTIHATPSAGTWKVSTSQGESQMRNALDQAKNAARVIQQQLSLSAMPVPIVAIKGKGVNLIDAPTNVVQAENLVKVIDAFEARKQSRFFEPSSVARLLIQHCNCDKAVMERHIARAASAVSKSEMASIVNSASLQ